MSYKDAYDYWTEERLKLNKEVLEATDQVLEKVPIAQITSQLSSQHVGTLFLQLNVEDIGVCLPLNTPDLNQSAVMNKEFGGENKGAIIATVKSSTISACSAGSMVSNGKFEALCLRFAEDFTHTSDDWSLDNTNDPNPMNLCNVKGGSYQVCSKTSKPLKESENAKWLLNIEWQMDGVHADIDTNIGKFLSALGQTLTAITGDPQEEEEDNEDSVTDEITTSSVSDDEDLQEAAEVGMAGPRLKRQKTQQIDLDLPSFLFDPNFEKSAKAKMLQQEINELAKFVEGLPELGASEATIAAETKKLRELQNIAQKNFKQEMAQKLRRQKSKVGNWKVPFGLGAGQVVSQHGHRLSKAKSINIASSSSPMREDMPSPFGVGGGKLKRIRSGEALDITTTIIEDDEDDAVAAAAADRRKPRRASMLPLDEVSEPETSISYDESPHFPRDKGKLLLGQSSKSGVDGGARGPRPAAGGGGGGQQQQTAPTPGAAAAAPAPSSEPNVDVDLHVKISISSGRCVLHTESENIKQTGNRTMGRDKSFSGNIFSTESPSMSRKGTNAGLRSATGGERGSGNDYRTYSQRTAHRDFRHQNVTTIYIPSLDVRVHYISKNEMEELVCFDSSIKDSWNMSTTRRVANKKATLTAWMTLQSIAEETIFTPQILEFLEQALQPLPTFSKESSLAGESVSGDPATGGGGKSPAGMATSAFLF